MSLLEGVAILVAGVAAGVVNTIAGAGTLITFPTLLAIGYPPVVANVSNTLGMVPGALSGAVGYRRELAGQRSRLLCLGAASAAGGLTGGLLLLALPAGVFIALVPVLIGAACALMIVQPWLMKRRAEKRARTDRAPVHRTAGLVAGVYGSGVYGGYFGAAQGVLLIALLGVFLEESLQRVNGTKNALAVTVNLAAAVLFILMADVAWVPALLIGVGTAVGGQVGAAIGRRLPHAVLRAAVVLVGVAAIADLIRR